MQRTIESQSARDELFRRIGRNVVAFQYLEVTLRSMIPALSNKLTLKELQTGRNKISRKHKKSPLGNLADDYHQKVFSKNVPDETVSDEVSSEPTLAFGVRIQVPPETEAQRKRELMKLIAERNRLIHKDLVSVDLDSRQECQKLSGRLDEQYTRIRRWLDYLNSVRTRVREGFLRLLESEEFQALLKGERDDAKQNNSARPSSPRGGNQY